jgi:AraC-like DNA-binding protein
MDIEIFPPAIPAGGVLTRHLLCQTTDLEEARQVGESIFCKNKTYSKDPKFNTRIYYRKLGKLGIGRMTYGGETIVEPGVMEQFALVQIPIKGREFIKSNDKQAMCTPEQGVIINANKNTYLHHTEDTEKLIIRVDLGMAKHQCQQHLGRTLHKDVEFDMEMALNTPEGRSLCQVLAWMYDVSSTFDELPPLLVDQLGSSFIGALLTCQPHNYSAELYEDKGRSIAPSFVKRVENYIEEHAHEPINIGDLAEWAGVSSRTLFMGFRQFRNTSPMNYLKEVRLRRVRDELVAAQPASGVVTAIAFRWGFSHLGHFTTDYKRRFGVSPSETLARSSRL